MKTRVFETETSYILAMVCGEVGKLVGATDAPDEKYRRQVWESVRPNTGTPPTSLPVHCSH